MSEIVVYGVIGSPFLRSAEVALKEKGAAYRVHAMAPGETKSAEHLGRHPFGRIPVLSHDGFDLYETQAILRYVDQIFPEPSLTPSEPRAAARMNQIIGINDWYLFPKAAAPVVFHRIIGPVLLGTSPDEAAIAEALPMARTCIDTLERLLGEQLFLAGDRLSLADILIAPQLALFSATREGDDLLRGSALAAWLARIGRRPSMIATEPPEALLKAA